MNNLIFREIKKPFLLKLVFKINVMIVFINKSLKNLKKNKKLRVYSDRHFFDE